MMADMPGAVTDPSAIGRDDALKAMRFVDLPGSPISLKHRTRRFGLNIFARLRD
jgi:hypothetical protein